ncbi:cobalt-precorrin 5A hydrolase [Methanothermobacter tenebrarum]|uniref:Cobalamin biosynthesis protein n=1 Tax=Methanothermobacter tenebrarum TaxID=680118 RepID=A0A328PCH0_9EURY|nr:cobalamin biosynthesis protein [Methanothermobacter tenebrarum]MBC7100734.1 cobalamin biosynthesis protein [Methanobacteriales archaeon]MBC7118252.1 cobalamin biosynthesis protein [Methanobacteriaceae archaeon]NPV65416.1 cobalamin biosynthesis protein [Methanobacteriaceae archaeon]RAO78881.1 cobalamin biosynthesis protein [Methanothermobacter tenebrarum]
MTKNGLEISKQLKRKLSQDPRIFQIDIFHKNVKKTLKEIFKDYDAIIGIMATGIMVRSICKLLSDKKEDPAIIVMDDAGKNVISLISGHLGGANDLTLKIAKLTKARPIITTSTDVHGYIGIDALAKKYYWQIKNTEKIVKFNKALLNGEKITIKGPENLEYLCDDPLFRKSYIIMKREDKIIKAILDRDEILIKPNKLVAGIGTKKGVNEEKIIESLKKSLSLLDLPLERLDVIATGEMKRGEKGIINASKILKKPLKFVDLDDLKLEDTHSRSSFVEDKFGVGSVCEAAALHVAGKGSRLILRKTTYNGIAIAIAVSREKVF